MSYRHAKVSQGPSLKLSTVALGLAVLVVGAVGVKALASPTTQVPVASMSEAKSECSALISGYQCRLDAAIDAATR